MIAVAPAGAGNWALRTLPKISGGFVVEQPGTGRVLAMQGGFESRVQAFNRASQAQRQPGSTIKPIAYSAALENGMTPASIIIDGPFCVDQGARLGQKCFRNFGGWRRIGAAHDALGHRAIAQPDDRARRRADRHGTRDRHDEAAGRRHLPALSRVRAGRGRDHADEDGQRLHDPGEPGQSAAADADRLRAGPPRQGDLARKLARLRGLQRQGLGRQGDAAPDHQIPPGDRPADRVPDGAHHRRRDPARHRDDAARPEPPDLRQDRHDDRPDRCVVHRRHPAIYRRAVPRVRQASVAGRRGAGRHHRGADLQAIRQAGVRGPAGPAVPRAQRHPHGPDRPGIGPQGLWRVARRERPEGVGDLGSVQARKRAAPFGPQGRGRETQAQGRPQSAQDRRDSDFLQRQGGIY